MVMSNQSNQRSLDDSPIATTSVLKHQNVDIHIPETDVPDYGPDGSINVTYKILKEISAELPLRRIKGQAKPFIPGSSQTNQIDYVFYLLEVRNAYSTT